jgi:hypothetical protein
LCVNNLLVCANILLLGCVDKWYFAEKFMHNKQT